MHTFSLYGLKNKIRKSTSLIFPPFKNSFLSYGKYFFSQVQVNTTPVKSKEELKVEGLMEQWPDFIKNATKDNPLLWRARWELESVYKYHQGDRNYLKVDDLPVPIYYDVLDAVMGCVTTEMVSYLYQEYEGFLTDHMIMAKFIQIAQVHGDLTDEFFQVIMPRVKETIKKADKSSGPSLFVAGLAASRLKIADKEFWDIYEHKLVNERLYRYLTLKQMADLSLSLSYAKRGSLTLFKLFEVNFIKHRKAISLQTEIKDKILFTYFSRKIGSNLLYEAITNPTITIPNLDPKIPIMDRPSNYSINKEEYRKLA